MFHSTKLRSQKQGTEFIYLLSIVLVLLIGAFVFSVNKNNAPVAVDDLTRRARQLYLAGDFKAAEKMFSQALEADRDNPELLAGVIGSIGADGSRSGNEAEAMKRSEKYVKKASGFDHRDVYTSLGYLEEINGNYDKAVQYYDKALNKDPDFAIGWFHKAHTLEFQGKKEESQKAYEKAFSLSSDDPLLLLVQGRNKVLAGNLDEGYDLFIRAANETNSNRVKVEALTNASSIKRSQGYVKASLEFSKKAVEVDRKFGPALANHGYNLVLIEGNFDDGINYLYEAMQANARSAQPYWWLGLVYRIGRKYDYSIDYLKRGIEMVDNDNTLVGSEALSQAKMQMNYDLARTYALAGRKNEAIETLKKAVEIRGEEEVREMLKKDVKNGFFKSLAGDAEFQSLMK